MDENSNKNFGQGLGTPRDKSSGDFASQNSKPKADFISLSDASRLTGYHQDYLGFLCRSGKLKGFKIGRNWVTTKPDLDQFMKTYRNGISEAVDETGTKIQVHVENPAPLASAQQQEFTGGTESKISKHEFAEQPLAINALSELGGLKKDVLEGIEQKVKILDGSVTLLENKIAEHGQSLQKQLDRAEAAAELQTAVIATPQSASLAQPERQTLHNKFSPSLDVRPTLDVKSLGSATEAESEENYSSAFSQDRIKSLYESFAKPSNRWPAVLGGSGIVAAAIIIILLLIGRPSGNAPFQISQTKIIYSLGPSASGTPASAKQVINQLLGLSHSQVLSLIDSQLNKYLAEGKFKGEKGDEGPAGPQGAAGIASVGGGYNPFASYTPSPGFTGGTGISTTLFSGDTGTFKNLTVTNQLTDNGGATFAGPTALNGTTTAVAVNISNQLTVGTTTPNSSAILEIDSTTQGFLAPRMTTAEINAIINPAAGLLVYNTDTNQYNVYNGSAWTPVGSGTGGGFTTGLGLIYNSTSTDSVLIGTSTPTSAELFVQGSGTKNPFTVATSTGAALLTVLANGKVAIGTTTPNSSAILEIDSTSQGFLAPRMTTAQINAVSSPTAGLLAYNTDTNQYNVYNGSGWVAVGSSSGAFTIGSGLIYNSTSTDSVLIGTSTPTSGQFAIQGSGVKNLLEISSSTGASLFKILAGGNVGIGITSPSYKLEVAGYSSSTQGNIGNLYSNGAVAGVNATSSTVDFLVKGSGTNNPFQINTSTGAAILQIVASGRFGYNSSTPTAIFSVQGTTTDVAVDILRVATSTGQTFFNITNSGNIGIGSTSPLTALLALQGTAGGTDLLNISSSTGVSIFRVTSGQRVGVGTTTPTSTFAIQGTSTNPGLDLFDIASSTGASALRVTNAGNVGIGTTSPSFALDVKASGATDPFRISTSSGLSLLTVRANGNVLIGTTTPSISFALQGTSTLPALDLFDVSSSTGASILRVTNAGNIGIGITSPNYKFEVAGYSSSTQGNIGNLYSNGSVAGVNATSSTVSFLVQGASNVTPLVVSSATGVTLLQVHRNGSVSIGTTTNAITFSVQGTSTNPGLDLFNIASSTGASLLRVTNSGNIGIGTTTPQGLLTLQGSSTVGKDLFSVASSSGATIVNLSWYGGLVQNIASTTAVNIQDGSITPSSVFTVDTTQSGSNAGIDITAGGSQTGNLLNFYSSGGTLLTSFTPAGGFVMNISSTTAMQIQNGSGSYVFNVDTVNAKVEVKGVGGNDPFQITSSTGVSMLKFTAAGSLGIGTTTPNASFVIQGTSTNPALDLFDVSSSTLFFASSSYFHITNAGKIGINTTTASSTFAIAYDATTSAGSLLYGGLTAGPVLQLGQLRLAGPSASGVYLGANAQPGFAGSLMLLQTNGTSELTVSSAGAVTANGAFTTATAAGYLGSASTGIALQSTLAATTASGGRNRLNNSVTLTMSNGAETQVLINSTFAPTTGSSTYELFAIAPTLSQLGTSSGVTRGIFIRPNIQVAFDYRAYESSGTIWTLSTSTNISIAYNNLITQETLQTASASAYTLANASTLNIAGAPIGGSSTSAVTITSSTALSIQGKAVTSGTGAVTNSYSLFLVTQTGATNNYAAVFLGGNVGIGSSTPTTTLLALQGTAGSTDLLDVASSTGVSVLRVTAGQRVGIGTTTPFATFALQGTSTNPTLDLFNVASSSGANPFVIKNTGSIGINSTTPNAVLAVQGDSNRPTVPIFTVASSTGQQILTITPINQAGYIGINTTSPTAQVHIWGIASSTMTGTASTTLVFGDNTASGSSTTLFGSQINPGDVLYGPDSQARIVLSATGTTLILNAPFSPAFTTATSFTYQSPLLKVTDDLGSPGLIVSANGQVTMDQTNFGTMVFPTDAGMVTWADMTVSSTPGSVPLGYTASLNGSPILTIYGVSDGLGNASNTGVGIGTTTPIAWLNIAPTINQAASDTVVTRDLYISPYVQSASDHRALEIASYIATTSQQSAAYTVLINPTTYATATLTSITNTITNAYTMYLGGAPVAGLNATIASTTILSIIGNNTVQTAGQGTTTNAYGLFLTAPSGATNNYAAVFLGGNVGIGTSSPNSKFAVVADCSGFTGNSIAGRCTDYAEIYPSAQPVQKGDVVTATSASSSLVSLSAMPYDSKILGVVSSNPAMLVEGNSVGMMNGSNYELDPLRPAIALAGRVPVRISSSTPIHAGDFLTSSSIAGLAMKAERSGQVIGQALEDFDPSTSTSSVPTVLVFVKPGYQIISNSFVLGEGDGQLQNATSSVAQAGSDAFLINQKGSGNILQLQNNGQNRFLVASSGAVSILAQVAGLKTNNVLTVSNGNANLFTINSVGDATFSGHIIAGKDTAGTATVHTGDDQVKVTFAVPYNTTPKIVASPDAAVLYAITDKSVTGFTITLSAPAGRDVNFDWFVIEQPQETNSTSLNSGNVLSVSPPPPPSPSPAPSPDPSPTPSPAPEPTPDPTPTPDSGEEVAGTSTPPSDATSTP